MFGKKGIVLCCLLINMSPLANAQTPSSQTEIERLQKITIFAIGSVGFVGHRSEGEILFRKILDASDARHIFLNTIRSPSSSNEAKLYAACGLQKISSADFSAARIKLGDKNETASVLRVDLLRKETMRDMLASIANHGCK